jgi:uncharacterized protein (DUF924 family)
MNVSSRILRAASAPERPERDERQQPRCTAQEILEFWSPPGLDADLATNARQLEWWFGGGAAPAVLARYRPLLEAAGRGDLDAWADQPRSRLALIILLDQFCAASIVRPHRPSRRTARRRSRPRWPRAGPLHPPGDRMGEDLLCASARPLEQLELLEHCVLLCEALIDEAPLPLRHIYRFSAAQARGHRNIVARFGRRPHRNVALGRTSTAGEGAYVAAGELVHQRSFRA